MRALALVATGCLFFTPAAAAAAGTLGHGGPQGQQPQTARLIASAIRLAVAPGATRGDLVRARQLVRLSRTAGQASQADLHGLARVLERAYDRAADLRGCHRALLRAGVIGCVRQLGLDAGRRRELGPLGNAIKQPLPRRNRGSSAADESLLIAGKTVTSPVIALDVDTLYHLAQLRA